MNLSAVCSWCTSEVEDLKHLFFDCELAAWCWSDVCSSWSVSWSRIVNLDFSLNRLFHFLQHEEFKIAWQMVVSATLWTIWLLRNDLIFNNVRWSKDKVLRILRARTFKWLEVSDILIGGMENLSYVNPRGAIKVCQSRKISEFWSRWLSKYDKVAAVDGAMHKSSGCYVKAGIGGVIRSAEGLVEYMFSGPSRKQHIFEVELEACIHVLSTMSRAIENGCKILICSDSAETVKFLHGLKFESDDSNLVPHEIIQMLKVVDIKAVNKFFNLEADGLAKVGMNRDVPVEKWGNGA